MRIWAAESWPKRSNWHKVDNLRHSGHDHVFLFLFSRILIFASHSSIKTSLNEGKIDCAALQVRGEICKFKTNNLSVYSRISFFVIWFVCVDDDRSRRSRSPDAVSRTFHASIRLSSLLVRLDVCGGHLFALAAASRDNDKPAADALADRRLLARAGDNRARLRFAC